LKKWLDFQDEKRAESSPVSRERIAKQKQSRWGGRRDGAGRESTGRKAVRIWILPSTLVLLETEAKKKGCITGTGKVRIGCVIDLLFGQPNGKEKREHT